MPHCTDDVAASLTCCCVLLDNDVQAFGRGVWGGVLCVCVCVCVRVCVRERERERESFMTHRYMYMYIMTLYNIVLHHITSL